jgi:hypothetical protein
MGDQERRDLSRGERMIESAVDECRRAGWTEERIKARVTQVFHTTPDERAAQGDDGTDGDELVRSGR